MDRAACWPELASAVLCDVDGGSTSLSHVISVSGVASLSSNSISISRAQQPPSARVVFVVISMEKPPLGAPSPGPSPSHGLQLGTE